MVRSAPRSGYVRRTAAERRPLLTMILTALSLLIFVVTLGLSLSLLYFMVESPLARRKMMTRLAAVQEVSIRNDEASDVLRRAVERYASPPSHFGDGSGDCPASSVPRAGRDPDAGGQFRSN